MTSQRTPSGSDLDNIQDLLARPITRRVALVRVAALPFATVVGLELVACSKGPQCSDTSSLSPDDARLRTEIAAYVEQSPDPAKHCSGCVQFTSGGEKSCGTCKVVKGPINPGGSCKLFVAKPA